MRNVLRGVRETRRTRIDDAPRRVMTVSAGILHPMRTGGLSEFVLTLLSSVLLSTTLPSSADLTELYITGSAK